MFLKHFSCLHKADDGMWVAYSRWPDKATRDAAWPGDREPTEKLSPEIRKAIAGIKNCKMPAFSLRK